MTKSGSVGLISTNRQGNLRFGGPKRNRLFVAAGQSLYAVYTATQGAGPS